MTFVPGISDVSPTQEIHRLRDVVSSLIEDRDSLLAALKDAEWILSRLVDRLEPGKDLAEGSQVVLAVRAAIAKAEDCS